MNYKNILRTDLHYVIRSSKFYQELTASKKYLSVPLNFNLYFRNNVNINSIYDIIKIFTVIQFWECDMLPFEVFDYIYKNQNYNWNYVFSRIVIFRLNNNEQYLLQLMKIVSQYRNKKLLREIAKNDMVELLIWYKRYERLNRVNNRISDKGNLIIFYSCLNGSFKMFRFGIKYGAYYTSNIVKMILSACNIKDNRVKYLNLLIKSGFKIRSSDIFECIRYDNDECFKYLLTQKIEVDLDDCYDYILKYESEKCRRVLNRRYPQILLMRLLNLCDYNGKFNFVRERRLREFRKKNICKKLFIQCYQ